VAQYRARRVQSSLLLELRLLAATIVEVASQHLPQLGAGLVVRALLNVTRSMKAAEAALQTKAAEHMNLPVDFVLALARRLSPYAHAATALIELCSLAQLQTDDVATAAKFVHWCARALLGARITKVRPESAESEAAFARVLLHLTETSSALRSHLEERGVGELLATLWSPLIIDVSEAQSGDGRSNATQTPVARFAVRPRDSLSQRELSALFSRLSAQPLAAAAESAI
jgi:hypothetical protein